MPVPLKYAVVERERRFLVGSLPEGVTSVHRIEDRYLTGTRLRLRAVWDTDGRVTRKLAHKVRLTQSPAEVACTNFYLDEPEWAVLESLPARTLRKTRYVVRRDGWTIAVDEHEDGTLVAEIDDRDQPSEVVPDWLDVLADVSDDEQWTGAQLAR